MVFLNKCLVCGKEVYKENLCKYHYFEKYIKGSKKIKKIKNFSIKFCPICLNFTYKNKKVSYNRLIKEIRERIKEIIDLDFKIEINERDKSLDIIIEPDLINYIVKIPIKIEVCKECSKIKAMDYNLIIQIRGKGKFIEKTYREIKGYLENREISIIKEEMNREGYDLFVYNKKLSISSFISFLSKKYSIKRSEKVISLDRQTSKLKKRITIVIREKDG